MGPDWRPSSPPRDGMLSSERYLGHGCVSSLRGGSDHTQHLKGLIDFSDDYNDWSTDLSRFHCGPDAEPGIGAHDCPLRREGDARRPDRRLHTRIPSRHLRLVHVRRRRSPALGLLPALCLGRDATLQSGRSAPLRRRGDAERKDREDLALQPGVWAGQRPGDPQAELLPRPVGRKRFRRHLHGRFHAPQHASVADYGWGRAPEVPVYPLPVPRTAPCKCSP